MISSFRRLSKSTLGSVVLVLFLVAGRFRSGGQAHQGAPASAAPRTPLGGRNSE